MHPLNLLLGTRLSIKAITLLTALSVIMLGTVSGWRYINSSEWPTWVLWWTEDMERLTGVDFEASTEGQVDGKPMMTMTDDEIDEVLR